MRRVRGGEPSLHLVAFLPLCFAMHMSTAAARVVLFAGHTDLLRRAPSCLLPCIRTVVPSTRVWSVLLVSSYFAAPSHVQGKTECCKFVLQYLMAKKGSSIENLTDKLIATNEPLECFGNAKTQNNDNSSRFAKCMQIAFDRCGSGGGSGSPLP